MDKSTELRKKAEKLLQQKGVQDSSLYNKNLETLIEELNIYQFELEHQNDELHRTQHELEKAKEKYAGLYEQAPVGYLTLAQTYKVLNCNTTLAEMLGYPKEKILGHPFTLNISPGSQDAFYHFARDIAKKGSRHRCEIVLHGANQLERHVRLDGMIEPVENGEEINIRATLTDITNEMQSRQIVRESEAKYRSIFDNSGDGILLFNTVILDGNRKLLEMLGLAKEELMGATPWEISPPVQPNGVPSKKMAQEMIARAREKKYVKFYWQHKRKDGSLLDTEVSLSLIQTPGGNELIAIIRDITENLAREKALQEKNQEIEQASQRLQNILHSISDGFFSLDENLRVTYFNKAAEDILGRKKHEVMGKNLFEAFPEAKGSVFEENYTKAIKKRVPVSFEAYFRVFPYENWYDVRVYPFEHGISVFFQVTTQRKLAEKKLAESEQRYKGLFNSNNDGILVVNTNREIEECNPYFTELFGYALEDIKGKTTDIIYANKQQFYEVGKQLKDNYGGEGFSEAILYKRKDGSTFYGDTNIFYHYDQDKKIIGFVGLIRDITQRLETETSLRENERKLDQMLQHLVDGFVMVDMEGQIMYANRAAENILDLEKDVILGRYYNATEWNHVRLDGSPMEPGELPVALTLEKNQVVTNFEHGIVSMEGETIWLSVNSAPLRDKDGKIYGAIASFRDISAGKLQEEELKREAAINKALARVGQELLLPDLSVEKISNIVLEVARDLFESPHGLVGSIDEETGDIICHSFTHMLDGKEQGTLRFKRGQDGYKNLWGKALKERKAICYNSLDELSVEEIPPDHSKMHSFISAPAIFNGELVGLVSLANAPRHYNQDDLYTLQRLADLYALALFRTKTEGEILDSKNRAEESDKLKSAFLANMSHEIRTPMNGILGFGQLLRKPGLPGEKREHFVNIINANGKHLLDLINDIIDISKIEANQLEINVVKCDVNQVIEELKLTFESSLGQLGKENLLLETRAKIPGKAWVYTDITRLKQVFTNLLSNAIKFTNEGHVRLGYDFKDTDTILFFVEDTGIGISPEKQKLVFERFRQADESTTRDFGGTGLGLSICQGLVRLFGGDIWVESEKDKGSVFYFTHPYKPATGPGQEVKISEILPEIIDWSSNKVLIVEDDPTSQIYLSECLSETGIQIVQAGDGQQAIDICFADKSIDLVLMDIQLPMKNGYEATQAIKQFRNDLPVIAQTAYAMENERDACFKAGCDGYVTKPIDIDKLVGEMMKHLVPK